MKFTRILSLILAVLMLAMTFVACAEEEVTDPGADAQPSATAAKLQLVDKGTAQYVIVRDYKAGGPVLDAVATMVDAFKTYLNCDITVQECYSDREVSEEEDVVQVKEILIGATNRPESAQVADGMKANDYEIDIVGEKVVLVGGSDAATAKAIVSFLSGFVYEQGDKNEVKKNGKKFDLFAYKDLPEGDANAKYDVNAEEFESSGIYSYDYATMGGTRLDSYVLLYPRDSVESAAYRNFALEMQGYVNKEVGFLLDVKKDAAILRADYKIVIGDTTYTDAALAESLGDDEYYIALTEEEITLEDGTTTTGATLTILFGMNAYDAAMTAFKQRIMPPSPTPIDFNMSVGFVATNMANPPAAE